MRRRFGALSLAILLPAVLLYQLFVHHVVVDSHNAVLRALIASLPLLAFLWWVARYARHKARLMLLAAATAVLIAVLEQREGLGLAFAYEAPHAFLNLALLWWFGRTLQDGRVPLITGFARKVHGVLPPRMERYTRNVTFAWVVFFAAQLSISALLFAFASLESWSFFVNVLNLPLLVAMFVIEYAFRIVRYRDFPHASIVQGIKVFSEDIRPPVSSDGVH